MWPRYLVVNGDESEPGTFKDRMLMERDPHQLIEGILIACYAVGAAQAFLYVRGEMALAQERIADRAQRRLRRRASSARTSSAPTSPSTSSLHWGAGAYIVRRGDRRCIESLEGNRGMPRIKPPFFPAAKGLYLQPTIVNNVETLSNLPWIMTNGGEEFAALGRRPAAAPACSRCPATSSKPGVYEVEFGVTLPRPDLRPGLGGGIRGDNELKAFIPGGASAPVVLSRSTSTCRSKPGAVGKAGSMLGSGAIVVMDETTDMVQGRLALVRFFARESCGKCTPCREGTPGWSEILDRMSTATAAPRTSTCCSTSCDNISPGVAWPPMQTTICPLGRRPPRRSRSAVIRCSRTSSRPTSAAPASPREPSTARPTSASRTSTRSRR